MTVLPPERFLMKPKGDQVHRTVVQMEHFGVTNVPVAQLN